MPNKVSELYVKQLGDLTFDIITAIYKILRNYPNKGCILNNGTDVSIVNLNHGHMIEINDISAHKYNPNFLIDILEELEEKVI